MHPKLRNSKKLNPKDYWKLLNSATLNPRKSNPFRQIIPPFQKTWRYQIK